jgi:Patatin-like phospholipase
MMEIAMPAEGENCYKLSRVLCEEFEALRPGCFANVDTRQVGDEGKKRQEAYKVAHNLGLSALALSGGGVRSACVGLGVIQALAEAQLLRRFDYLSTVSGGGYIGSWLSAWLYWNKTEKKESAETVPTALTTRRDNPNEEPEPIRHLRAYSSYLTPKLGVTSADTWAAVTLVVRNLVLSWLILAPIICLMVLSIKIAAGVLHTAVLVSWSFADQPCRAPLAGRCRLEPRLQAGAPLPDEHSESQCKNRAAPIFVVKLSACDCRRHLFCLASEQTAYSCHGSGVRVARSRLTSPMVAGDGNDRP